MLFPKLGLTTAIFISSCLHFAKSKSNLQLGNGFSLFLDPVKEILQITSLGTIIWETVPGEGFLSASSGNDQVFASQGNFKITQVDQAKCSGQKIDRWSYEPEPEGLNGKAVAIHGRLRDCGNATFSIFFWAPKDFPDRVAFRIALEPGTSKEDPVSKLFLTFRSDPSEDFYGLGAQASFASLKHLAIPVSLENRGLAEVINLPRLSRIR